MVLSATSIKPPVAACALVTSQHPAHDHYHRQTKSNDASDLKEGLHGAILFTISTPKK